MARVRLVTFLNKMLSENITKDKVQNYVGNSMRKIFLLANFEKDKFIDEDEFLKTAPKGLELTRAT